MSIERKNTGDKLKIAARDWNELARTADVVEELRNQQGAGGGSRLRLDPTSVWVKNSTNANLLPGSIVGLASLAVGLAVGEWPVFEIAEPGSNGRVGILIDALPADETSLARCVVSGVVRTVVNLSDAEHLFAAPNGTYDSLDSSTGGNIRILWAEGVGDDQDALVRIEAGAADGCNVPIALRIDGGDADDGYEWTAMRQTNADPGEWEVISGWNSTYLGFAAFEANNESVTAGTTIYPGQIDFCRNKAFFFARNSTSTGRVIVEFQETLPSKGELYVAKIFIETVGADGLVAWTQGATVYAFPINNLTPTLETLYFARRTENEELVSGYPVYKVDRCCDVAPSHYSSGNGPCELICNGEDWGWLTGVTYTPTDGPYNGTPIPILLTLTYDADNNLCSLRGVAYDESNVEIANAVGFCSGGEFLIQVAYNAGGGSFGPFTLADVPYNNGILSFG